MSWITIGFSYPKTFKLGAAAISWWTKAKYSHVYLRFQYSNSKDAVFHAAHGMVHFKSVDNFLKENNSIKEYSVEISQECHDRFFDDCMELAGEKYSITELVKIFISDIAFSVCNKTLTLGNSKGYICSELVGKLCEQHLFCKFNKPTYLLKPTDVDTALEEIYGKINTNN